MRRRVERISSWAIVLKQIANYENVSAVSYPKWVNEQRKVTVNMQEKQRTRRGVSSKLAVFQKL